MKATISGVEKWSTVTLIPETDQEILTLEQFAEGGFNNVREYKVNNPLNIVFKLQKKVEYAYCLRM